MSGGAGTDREDYYRSWLGPAIKMALTDAPSVSPVLPDARYMLILRATSGSWAWVKPRAFSSDAADVTADVPACPMSPDVLVALEYNARSESNQVQAVMETGQTGTLYIVRISRGGGV